MELFTNSMLKDWQTCKNKYYYKYVKKIMLPQKEENFELGKKVHALISYKLNGFDTSILEKSANPEILENYKSILKHPLMNQESFRSEWGFTVNIADTKNLFVGRIDAIFYNKEKNHYTIADWKTGMKIPQNPMLDRQAQIYLYSFYKTRNDLKIDINPENISFTFVQTPSLNESTIDFSEELYEKFEKDFVKTIKEINNYNFKPEFDEQKNCKFCEYKFICQKKSQN